MASDKNLWKKVALIVVTFRFLFISIYESLVNLGSNDILVKCLINLNSHFMRKCNLNVFGFFVVKGSILVAVPFLQICMVACIY